MDRFAVMSDDQLMYNLQTSLRELETATKTAALGFPSVSSNNSNTFFVSDIFIATI